MLTVYYNLFYLVASLSFERSKKAHNLCWFESNHNLMRKLLIANHNGDKLDDK